MKSTKKRQKINWLAIIGDSGAKDLFDTYRFAHRGISLNRAARSFVIKYVKDIDYRNTSRYFKGQFVSDECDQEGVYDSPSMKEARKRLLGL